MSLVVKSCIVRHQCPYNRRVDVSNGLVTTLAGSPVTLAMEMEAVRKHHFIHHMVYLLMDRELLLSL